MTQTAKNVKTQSRGTKRIHTVTLKRMADPDPDTSHLGRYSAHAEGDYSIDRQHAESCIVNTGTVTPDTPCAICDKANNLHEEHKTDDPDSAGRFLCPSADGVISDPDSVDEFEPVECSECGECRNMWDSREYRYFNTSGNYKGLPEADIRKYTWQDYRRMEDLNNSGWSYVGVRAEAEVSFGESRGGVLMQTLTSGGLWGIESDSGSYFAEVEKEELADLRGQLEAAGFSKRAVTAAFRNVQRKDS